jgi:hypothetical protein
LSRQFLVWGFAGLQERRRSSAAASVVKNDNFFNLLVAIFLNVHSSAGRANDDRWLRVQAASRPSSSTSRSHRRRVYGKSARIIMTMGMPGIVYRWWFGAH